MPRIVHRRSGHDAIARPDRRRRAWFRVLTVASTLALALAAAEIVCRARDRAIQGSDRIDPGLIHPDPWLGWRLTPGWSGTHEHHDFRVQYRLGADGFRASDSAPAQPGLLVHAFVGDSFTFGLGVDDDETFVELLNQRASELGRFLNFGVPGYSTDQEALLIEETVLARRPTVIWLVVCLANDFFDNQRAVSLQTRLPKPFFKWQEGRLELRNFPVNPAPSLGQFTEIDTRQALLEAVFGPGGPPPGPIAWLGNHFALARLVASTVEPREDHGAAFTERFAPAIALFDQLIERIASRCRTAGVELRLVALPGRSFVEQPGSYSAQYQESFLTAAVGIARERNLRIVDLACGLLNRTRSGRDRWFFPHDGHLTPRGHKLVAELLVDRIRE